MHQEHKLAESAAVKEETLLSGKLLTKQTEADSLRISLKKALRGELSRTSW